MTETPGPSRRVLAIGAAFVAALVSTWPTTDPDLWWHLADGRYFAVNGVVATDPFSLTMRGAEWVAHEWLSDIFMFRVQDWLGVHALPLVYGLIVAAGWMILYGSTPGEPFRKLALTGLAGVAIAPVVGARPQMHTLVLLALLVALTERIRDGRLAASWFWVLVPMVVLWANLHAGFYVAFAYLFAVAAGSLLERFTGRPGRPASSRALSPGALGHLGGAMVVAFFGILATPHGAKLWTYPFATLGDPITQRFLVEWRSPDFGNLFLWPYLLFVLVGLTGLAVRRPRPDAADLLLYAGTLAASLFSVRHIALHAVVALPLLYRLWAPPSSRPVGSVFAMGVTLVAIAGYGIHALNVVATNPGAVSARFPVAAVEHFQDSGLAETRIYNDFPWGGYLLWNGIPPFIDGRTDMYGPEFLEDTLDALFVREGWEEPLDRYDIETALLTPESNLAQLLADLPAWEEVYRDDEAVAFRRRQ